MKPIRDSNLGPFGRYAGNLPRYHLAYSYIFFRLLFRIPPVDTFMFFLDFSKRQIVIAIIYHPDSVLRAGAKRNGATCPYLPMLPAGEGRPGGALGPGVRKAEPYNQINFHT